MTRKHWNASKKVHDNDRRMAVLCPESRTNTAGNNTAIY